MKHLLLVFALLLPASVFAAPADRDVLLTPSGTLYSIEAATNHRKSPTNVSTRYLALTAQNSDAQSTIAVPASVTGGNHRRPKLAYDAETATLFVFWLRSQNSVLATSDLVFCALRNGVWTEPIIVDDAPYRNRSNFSIAVTRKAEMNEQLSIVQVAALTLHLVWWDESGAGNAAYYATVGIEDGSVIDMQVRPLSDLVDSRFEMADAAAPESLELFRHPTVVEAASQDSVEIIFGDVATNRFHRTTVKTFLTRPQPNLRVRIPINVKDRGFRGPARGLSTGDGGNISAVTAGEDGAIFYAEEQGVVKYITYRNNAWSGTQSIVLGENLTAESAVSALRRMAATH